MTNNTAPLFANKHNNKSTPFASQLFYMQQRIAKIALAIPLYTFFDYGVPASIDSQKLIPGCRVRVPFGKNQRTGFVIELATSTQVEKKSLKYISTLLDDEALFDAKHLDYLSWIARYYQQPPGEVILTATPPRLRQEKALLSLNQTAWALTAEGSEATPEQLSRAPKQKALLELLQNQGSAIADNQLKTAGFSPAIINSLLDKNWLLKTEITATKPDLPETATDIELTQEQLDAIDQVKQQLQTFSAFLLDGVTGSGKTEVYLELASAVIAQGKNVLLLVPEIALTPQLLKRFQERFGDAVAGFHSALADAEKERLWHRMRKGLIPVVVGTRSAILAPIKDLGLILVDEEHDLSYKQQDGLRYYARDLAVVRAHRADCPVVLGSATASLETLHNAKSGRYQHLKLTARPGTCKPPAMHLVDIRDQKLDQGFSPVLLKAIKNTLENNQQVIIFLNRRGFAPVLTCYSCGWVSDCPRCDAKQTVHARMNALWCHHCGSQRRLPVNCPDCGAADLHPLGQGTERLEQTLTTKFPDYPMIRVDRDATRKKGSMDKLLAHIHGSDAAIMVGTQMLAKGHHFPKVTLVCVLNADGGLFSADFRAPEHMAQLLVQVAGRAGRGEQPGKVLIQSRFPEHPLLQTLIHAGFTEFAQAALDERELAQLPPYAYQVLIRAEAHREDFALQFLQDVSQVLQPLINADIEIWGPVPASMQRRAGRYRAHLLVQSHQRLLLQKLFARITPTLGQIKSTKNVRWSIDVDPQETL